MLWERVEIISLRTEPPLSGFCTDRYRKKKLCLQGGNCLLTGPLVEDGATRKREEKGQNREEGSLVVASLACTHGSPEVVRRLTWVQVRLREYTLTPC